MKISSSKIILNFALLIGHSVKNSKLFDCNYYIYGKLLLGSILFISTSLFADILFMEAGPYDPDAKEKITHENYSLSVKQARLTDILSHLEQKTGIEIKAYTPIAGNYQDYSYQALPLDQILKNLLRDYSTVMVYEDEKTAIETSAGHRLKKLWILGADDSSSMPLHSAGDREDQGSLGRDNHDYLSQTQYRELAHIENLQGMTSDDVIETLKETLILNQDPVIRKKAVSALADIGGVRVLDALEAGLGDRSGEVRVELARSFAPIAHQRSLLALSQLLLGDMDSSVRIEAVRSLYKFNKPPARVLVESALNDINLGVKIVARTVLSHWEYDSEWSN